MRQRSRTKKPPAEKEIRRRPRKQHSAEERVRALFEGLPGKERIAEHRRRGGIATSLYDKGSKAFLGARKKRLVGDTAPGEQSGGEGAPERGGRHERSPGRSDPL